MRILMVHNRYQQRGGEDISTEQDIALLQEHGHQVKTYFRHNDEIREYTVLQKALLFFRPTWSWRSYQHILRILKSFQPEIVHVQNFFPLISPSVFYACHRMNVPVVFSLRNYRLACANAYFYRDDHVCEECIHHSPLRGIIHKCYHRSHLHTLSISLMQLTHRLLGTWNNKVTIISPVSHFAGRKMIETGLDKRNIVVRKNFLASDPGTGKQERSGAVFVGRLSPEKGIATLIEAWQQFPDVPLKIIGAGPEYANLMAHCKDNPAITLTGRLPHAEMLEEVKKARFLVMPSVWYETFGRTIIEAYATGTPVIASDLGAVAELVTDGETGLLFKPGDAIDLAAKISWAMDHENELAEMGKQARSLFLDFFADDIAYQQLLEIYQKAIKPS